MSEETVEVEQETVEPQVEESTPSDDAGSDTPEEKPEKSGYQKRIDQLTAKNYAVEEDRDYWRNKALELERAKPEEPKPEPKARPVLADFDHDVEAFSEALIEWTQEQVTTATEAKAKELTETAAKEQQEKQQQEANDARIKAFQERSETFAAKNPDYYTLLSNPTLAITPEMTNVIMEMENGPEVAYHLAQHPEKALQIAQKSPTQIALSLARINAKPDPQPTSSAPEPPKPIKSGSGGNTKYDPRDARSDKLSTTEWMKARQKQLRQGNG